MPYVWGQTTEGGVFHAIDDERPSGRRTVVCHTITCGATDGILFIYVPVRGRACKHCVRRIRQRADHLVHIADKVTGAAS